MRPPKRLVLPFWLAMFTASTSTLNSNSTAALISGLVASRSTLNNTWLCFTTRVARYHNVYGPLGTYEGGREKAPAAMCRKVIAAKLSGKHEIEIWGDGQQTRSFMYIDDCLKGTQAILNSEILEPINLGSSELVSINQLVDIVEEIAGIKLKRSYNLSAPKGVNGRNSDNTLIREYLGWEPSVRLRDGMEQTYRWIHDQMKDSAVSVPLTAVPGLAVA